MIDPDAGDGPDHAWYRAELDACRTRIAELERERINAGATYRAMRPIVEAALAWHARRPGGVTDLQAAIDTYLGRRP